MELSIGQKILVVALIVLVGLTAMAFALQQWTIINTGNVVSGIDITVSPLTLDWDNLTINQSKSQIVTVTNANNTDVVLLISAASLPTYLTLNWNYTGQTLLIGKSLDVNFTLTVKPEATPQHFNFDIIITTTAA